nr:MAG TPA: serine protease [Caudoviricetes sp.]
MNIPVYNCIIDENINDETGIYAISFVDFPANETDFVTLGKGEFYLNKDSKKQILTGVVLRPEQMIYRNSPTLGEYYIKFSAEQIEKIAHKMMKTGIALYNTTHQHQSLLTGNYLTELWIVENPKNDKSNALGFKDLPKGTLMCSYKVEDSSYWNSEIMSGNVKGFSLEGFFNQEICMSKLSNKNNLSMKKKRFVFNKTQRAALSLILSKEMLSDIESVEADDTTDSGITLREFVLADGKTVLVDADGFATLDGEQMPAGEHKLADGNIMVIDENGNFVETKEASATTTDPEETTAAQALKEAKHKLAKERARKQKLEEQNADPATVAELEAKIAEMQTTIDTLTKALEDATKTVEEVKEVAEELKKKTPSASPVVQPVVKVDMSKMSATERMAHAASLAMQRKTKK